MADTAMHITRSAAPIREQVVRMIKSAIMSGQFAPGERLTEKRLCEMTDVSRTSIREALRTLESDGLITMVPNHGPIVTVLTEDEVRDTYRVRAVLEGYAVELFTINATDDEVTSLDEAFDEMARAQNDVEQLLERRDHFYEILLEGAKSPLTASILRSLQDQATILRRANLLTEGRPKETLSEFDTVMKAVRARGAAAAREAMSHHIQNAQRVALRILPETSSVNPSEPDQ